MRGVFHDTRAGQVKLEGPLPAPDNMPDPSELLDDAEPIFIIRAGDQFAMAMLSEYARQAELHGIMSVRMRVKSEVDKFKRWRGRHPQKLKYPD